MNKLFLRRWLLGTGLFFTVAVVTAAPLQDEAYVWRRNRTTALTEPEIRAAPILSRLVYLAAELRVEKNQLQVERIPFPTTARAFVVRIGLSVFAPGWNSRYGEQLKIVLADLQRQSVEEIQLDFDCPTRKLSIYAGLLKELRAAFPELRLVPTILPDWLTQPEFRELLNQVPAYVLQVHAVDLVNSTPLAIFRKTAAAQAIQRASRMGVPFRVALPTYGCEAWYDHNNKLLGIMAEDPRTIRTIPSRKEYLLSDATELATFARGLRSSLPVNCTGLIWYRLPFPDDQRHWSWLTFSQVVSGVIPESKIVGRLQMAEPGLYDLILQNDGAAHGSLPKELRLICSAPEIESWDVVNGYTAEAKSSGLSLVWQGKQWPWLAPQESRPIGWIRLRKDASPNSIQFIP